MITIDINEMQKEFSAYIGKVNAGETLLIVQEGDPIAEIKPVARVVRELWPTGLCALSL